DYYCVIWHNNAYWLF
nr:immunoglobulin light chain junction region [Macaca mulatta]MOW04196.1 immunoglobulin light chain junction region [Macaca mulatta]MOW04670.1 immunoglobulin light chain junction region [Macaca mulatta]MOW04728.1 immunoglobulin light chain junction region [Macaca mulatta]MOW05034.1 immunoglobulin light chain junction region [Macaca mulatta]